MIYFAQIDSENGPVKIGMAKNVVKRIKQFQKHMPWSFKIIKTIEGGRDEEKAIHQKLCKFRMKDSNGREWFSADAMRFVDFLGRISERNLTAERKMTSDEWKQYFDILFDCVRDQPHIQAGSGSQVP